MSSVVPLWLMATSTSPFFNSEIEVSAVCKSDHATERLPRRLSLSWRSIATYPLDANPIIPMVFAFSQTSTVLTKVSTSSLSAVVLIASASAYAIFRITSVGESSTVMPPSRGRSES